jgi:hypothetical protein
MAGRGNSLSPFAHQNHLRQPSKRSDSILPPSDGTGFPEFPSPLMGEGQGEGCLNFVLQFFLNSDILNSEKL